MTAASEHFASRVPDIMDWLIRDFTVSPTQAAGIMGNLGHESLGLTVMQEMRPTSGRGGYGWAQWTGSRRVAYESFCAKNSLDPASEQGNYGYLRHELLTAPYAHAVQQVKKTSTIEAATETFEHFYEKAGVPALESRYKWARLALGAWQETHKPAPPIVVVPPVVPAGSQLDRIEAALARIEARLGKV